AGRGPVAGETASAGPSGGAIGPQGLRCRGSIVSPIGVCPHVCVTNRAWTRADCDWCGQRFQCVDAGRLRLVWATVSVHARGQTPTDRQLPLRPETPVMVAGSVLLARSRNVDPATSVLLHRRPREQESAHGKEVGEPVGMLVTRQPMLHPAGVVQLRVAPPQVDRGGGPAALRRAARHVFAGCVTGCVTGCVGHPGTVQGGPVP
ncbi:MAG: hypothetical protein JWO57_4165, partial [Pseudonocardiales bacterium]|nr:hypothetical protein [Pseudonocardiales bacterium]